MRHSIASCYGKTDGHPLWILGLFMESLHCPTRFCFHLNKSHSLNRSHPAFSQLSLVISRIKPFARNKFCITSGWVRIRSPRGRNSGIWIGCQTPKHWNLATARFYRWWWIWITQGKMWQKIFAQFSPIVEPSFSDSSVNISWEINKDDKNESGSGKLLNNVFQAEQFHHLPSNFRSWTAYTSR
jgi:hypothetical protein